MTLRKSEAEGAEEVRGLAPAQWSDPLFLSGKSHR